MGRIAHRIYNGYRPDSADIDCLCPLCGKADYVSITQDEADALDAGQPVHEVLPHRTKVERERIISQICPDCQANLC